MAKRYYWKFRVSGRGAFPTDMLRYDRCCPYSQKDVLSMDGREDRTVELISHLRTPEESRWESFNWQVMSLEKCEM